MTGTSILTAVGRDWRADVHYDVRMTSPGHYYYKRVPIALAVFRVTRFTSDKVSFRRDPILSNRRKTTRRVSDGYFDSSLAQIVAR